MNELKIFENPEFGQVRMAMVNEEPWFVGKDVAEALGYAAERNAIASHVDDEDKLTHQISASGQMRNVTLINESGVYSLVFSSKLENAKRFKRWVTSEVLPSIRKNGAYMTEETLEKALLSPDYLIRIASELKKEKDARKEVEAKNIKLENEVIGLNDAINELKPKADYLDRILKSTSLVTTTQIAKDYGMGAPSLNKKLKELKVQHKVGGQWVLTYKYHGKGYVFSETIDIEQEDGRIKTVMYTKWTQKGRLFLYDLLKKNGTVPVIEMNLENRES